MNFADEMGIGTVIVPRCVGRANDRQGGSEMHLAEHMTLQDQRLMWDIKNHPTVLAFALEGDTSPHRPIDPVDDTLVDNPQGLPVFCKHLPVRLFQVEYNPDNSYKHQCRPERCASSCCGNCNRPKFLDLLSIAKSYAEAHIKDSLWRRYPLLDKLEGKTVLTIQKSFRRGVPHGKKPPQRLSLLHSTQSSCSSDIKVNTSPNAWVELQMPGQTPIRRRSDATGLVNFWVYHEGPATLECSSGSQSITIEADAWVDFVHQANNSPISCP